MKGMHPYGKKMTGKKSMGKGGKMGGR